MPNDFTQRIHLGAEHLFAPYILPIFWKVRHFSRTVAMNKSNYFHISMFYINLKDRQKILNWSVVRYVAEECEFFITL